MISVKEIVEKLRLEVVSSAHALDRPVAGGYASDLLSCVMKGAKKDYIWVTLQSHVNVVAVASLIDLAGVILTEGNRPDQETLSRAENEGVTLLLTPRTTYSVVGDLHALGIKGNPE
jgi:serine kinase of HPr protein (carbohydrate metabolism regulator)